MQPQNQGSSTRAAGRQAGRQAGKGVPAPVASSRSSSRASASGLRPAARAAAPSCATRFSFASSSFCRQAGRRRQEGAGRQAGRRRKARGRQGRFEGQKVKHLNTRPTTINHTAHPTAQRPHLLACRLAVLAAEHKGGGGAVDAVGARPPVAAQAGQRKHHVLRVGHGGVVHCGACRARTQHGHSMRTAGARVGCVRIVHVHA